MCFWARAKSAVFRGLGREELNAEKLGNHNLGGEVLDAALQAAEAPLDSP